MIKRCWRIPNIDILSIIQIWSKKGGSFKLLRPLTIDALQVTPAAVPVTVSVCGTALMGLVMMVLMLLRNSGPGSSPFGTVPQ